MLVRFGTFEAVVWLSLVVVGAAPSAHADVVVGGTPEAIEVVASRSTVGEVLQKLSDSYALELHGAEGLNEPLTGTFKGDLRSIVEQVLAQHNHATRPEGGRLGVFITASSPTAPATVVAPASGAVAASGDPAVAEDPATTGQKEPPQPILSPEGQRLAVKMFGEKGRYLQVDETLLRSFANGRGGRRFTQPAP